MNKLKLFTAILMATSFMSCENMNKGKGSANSADSLSADSCKTDTVIAAASPLQDENQVKKYLQDFYEKYIFNIQKTDSSFEEAVQASCTPKLQKYLESQYEYECENGPCYAQTCFRSDAQDGPSEEYKVVDIKSEGDGWFKVQFIDMGIRDSVNILCVADGNQIKMDDIKRISK